MKNIWRIALQPALMMPTQRPHSEPAQMPNAARNWIGADGEKHPAPRVEVGDDVLRVRREDRRLVDRGDPVDDVQDPDDRERVPANTIQPSPRSSS